MRFLRRQYQALQYKRKLLRLWEERIMGELIQLPVNLTDELREHWEQQLVDAERAVALARRVLGLPDDN